MGDNSQNFAAWWKENIAEQQTKEIAAYGADVAWPGLACYADTHYLYTKFKDDVWKALCEDADSQDFAHPLEMILKTFPEEKLKKIRSCAEFENLLFWYLVERTAEKFAAQ
ncbi:MAG: hypothetical protein JXB25_11120 [Deltaproteobacteria bacterium]|nr:hypothetical protein [Deltaproteobacteria bacterium]